MKIVDQEMNHILAIGFGSFTPRGNWYDCVRTSFSQPSWRGETEFCHSLAALGFTSAALWACRKVVGSKEIGMLDVTGTPAWFDFERATLHWCAWAKRERCFGRGTYTKVSLNSRYDRYQQVRLLYDHFGRGLSGIRGCKRTEDHSPARVLLSLVKWLLHSQHQMGGAYEQF